MTGLQILTAGEYLYHAGDEAREVYELLSGRVRLEHVTPDGHQFDFLAGAGDLVGDVEVLAGLPRQMSATAVRDGATVRILDPEAFVSSITRAQVRALAVRLAESHRRIVEAFHQPARARIAETLHYLARTEGNTLELNREDLAHLTGVRPETVCRILARMRETGILATERKRIVILRPDLLGILE